MRKLFAMFLLAMTTNAHAELSNPHPSVLDQWVTENGMGDTHPDQSELDKALSDILARASVRRSERQSTNSGSQTTVTRRKAVEALTEPSRAIALANKPKPTTVVHPTVPTRVSEREIQCLMRNLYHEAYGEGERGMIAVAHVVMNRVRSPNYQNTICNVVYAPYQFSWTLSHKRNIPAPTQTHSTLRRIAEGVINGTIPNPIGSALSFHASHVTPTWSRQHRRIAQIGNHIFYSHR